MLGRRRLALRPRRVEVEDRAMNTETMTEAMYPAQANHKKAVDAWDSRQRFVMLFAPLVISLLTR
jgi:hypothetical protein